MNLLLRLKSKPGTVNWNRRDFYRQAHPLVGRRRHGAPGSLSDSALAIALTSADIPGRLNNSHGRFTLYSDCYCHNYFALFFAHIQS